MIKIALKNAPSPGTITDAEIEAMLPAFDQQWNKDLAAVWSVEQATFSFETCALPEDAWWLIFQTRAAVLGGVARP